MFIRAIEVDRIVLNYNIFKFILETFDCTMKIKRLKNNLVKKFTNSKMTDGKVIILLFSNVYVQLRYASR